MKWEYRTIRVEPQKNWSGADLGAFRDAEAWKAFDEELNRLGQEGWELVSAAPVGLIVIIYTLKRPISAPE